MEPVLNLYKPRGHTPLQVIREFRQRFPEYAGVPLTYAGRLDPMAEGVLLVLSGAEAKNRERYLGLDKAYVADLLFGLKTDTGDALGLVTAQNLPAAQAAEAGISEAASSLRGILTLPVPAYSSVPVRGQPLFIWARQGKLGDLEIPRRDMRVFRADVMEIARKPARSLLRDFRKRVAEVRGDFRQEEILRKWAEILEGEAGHYPVATVRIQCASGTYIRSVAEELGRRLGVPAMLYRLVRTAVGPYGIAESMRV